MFGLICVGFVFDMPFAILADERILRGDKITGKKPPYNTTGETTDMWIPVEVVGETRSAELTISPVHKCNFK